MDYQNGNYYVNGQSGMLKITGVAWLIRYGNDYSSLCVENRVALTKAEQKSIGDTQPFMLDDVTYDKDGNVIDDSILAKAYLDKMVAKGKVVKLTREVVGEESMLIQIASDAKKRKNEFNIRHFLMAVLREGIKGGENPFNALKRGIQEECKKRFKAGADEIQHKFVYERRENTCLLVYFVDGYALEDDEVAISRAGKCNYFCAKSLAGVIDNDYLETRSHEVISNKDIEGHLEAFAEDFGEDGIGCDLKYWGGMTMWQECKKYF